LCQGITTVTTCTGALQCCPGTGCVDFQTDNNNCGGCGHGCSGDQECCGAQCVPLTDPRNCGKCGNACLGPLDMGNGACCACPNGYICGLGGKCMCPLPPV
jgi:hypothetical protein